MTEQYRPLTADERQALQAQGCTAQDWDTISVATDFDARYVRDVDFYGDIRLGVFSEELEVAPGFRKHTGINKATLRNCTVEDNALIERSGG